jgi:hypothetical protein
MMCFGGTPSSDGEVLDEARYALFLLLAVTVDACIGRTEASMSTRTHEIPMIMSYVITKTHIPTLHYFCCAIV